MEKQEKNKIILAKIKVYKQLIEQNGNCEGISCRKTSKQTFYCPCFDVGKNEFESSCNLIYIKNYSVNNLKMNLNELEMSLKINII